MLNYTIRRLLIAAILVLIVGVIGQVAIYMIPGDPAYLILGAEMAPDPEMLKAVREELGLDQPLYVQILRGLGGFLRLDLGSSFQDKRPITTLVAETFPVSFALVISATLFAIVFGMTLGALAAVKHNTFIDWLATVVATLGISTPVFVTGTFMIYLFSLHWRLVPATAYASFGEDPANFLKQLMLPMLAAGIAHGAETARMTRSSMLETLRADYITTARSKGLTELAVNVRHGLRTALIPVVAMIGVQFGSMFGRTVLIEVVFNWPGMMSTMVSAATFHDFPVVRGILIVVAGTFIVINLITDLFYAYLDPRIVYD
jgi:ABC-type dipeptide/oligopeptide/nickel transport system permease component